MFCCPLLKKSIYPGHIKGQINKQSLWAATHFGVSRKKKDLNCTKKGTARENIGVANNKGVHVKDQVQLAKPY